MKKRELQLYYRNKQGELRKILKFPKLSAFVFKESMLNDNFQLGSTIYVDTASWEELSKEANFDIRKSTLEIIYASNGTRPYMVIAKQREITEDIKNNVIKTLGEIIKDNSNTDEQGRIIKDRG